MGATGAIGEGSFTGYQNFSLVAEALLTTTRSWDLSRRDPCRRGTQAGSLQAGSAGGVGRRRLPTPNRHLLHKVQVRFVVQHLGLPAAGPLGDHTSAIRMGGGWRELGAASFNFVVWSRLHESNFAESDSDQVEGLIRILIIPP